MNGSRPVASSIRKTVLAILATLVAADAHAAGDDEPLQLRAGDLMKASSSVRMQNDYRCEAIKAKLIVNARLIIDMKQGELVLFEASVNGKKLPPEQLSSAKDDMLRKGAFDFVSFACNESSYGFYFQRWSPNSPDPYIHRISGWL